MNEVARVGITGGIGAGKSLISNIFKILGIPVYDADSRARWLMNHDPHLKKAITGLFGEKAYNSDGLDRKWIARQTFQDKNKLDQLNAVVHPAVGEDYLSWQKNQKGPYSIKEAALLYEAGSYKELDKVIVVTAPDELRIERVLQRDTHRTKSDVEAIMKNQWPQQKKEEMADFVISNDGSQMVLPQVLAIHEELIA